MPILTAIDSIGIQRFVFASNRLRDVVAGSALVKEATGKGFLERHLNGTNGASVLAAAGGNALLRFTSLDDARRFAGRYSRALLETAPGLEVVVVHREYAGGSLAAAIAAIQVDLARSKGGRAPQAPMLGLAVTAPCASTRLPATDVLAVSHAPNDRPAPVSAGIAARRRTDESATPVGEFVDGRGRGLRLVYPDEIDQMGRSFGDTSLIGVIHLDGNNIGAKISAWLQQRQGETDDDRLAADYAAITHELSNAAGAALRAVQRAVVDALTPTAEGAAIEHAGLDLRIDLSADGDRLYLPIRPVLLGGDDLTLICDGRLALDLAVRALTAFGATDAPLLNAELTASAGIALVGAHSPFSRAYDLADELCNSAKGRVRALGEASALDWQIVSGGSADDLATLRGRYASVAGGQDGGSSKEQPGLTMRPYLLDDADGAETWRWLADTVLDGDGGLRGPRWAASRSKVKRLGELAARGPAAVRETLAGWQVADPSLQLPDGLADGFRGGRTPLLDAVELLDIHLPLTVPDVTTPSPPLGVAGGRPT